MHHFLFEDKEYRINPRFKRRRNEQDSAQALARLDNLRKLNLCAFKDGGYKLSSRWEEDLWANGRYIMFLQTRSGLRYTNPANLKLYSGLLGDISGTVTKIYRTDGDASDNHAVVIESPNGKAYFVPLLKKPEALRFGKRKNLKEGEAVTIKTYENQRGRLTPLIFH